MSGGGSAPPLSLSVANRSRLSNCFYSTSLPLKSASQIIFSELVRITWLYGTDALTDLALQHFDWADNTLFFDEIPHGTDPDRTAFFIGGKDIILDAGVRAGCPQTALTPSVQNADLISPVACETIPRTTWVDSLPIPPFGEHG